MSSSSTVPGQLQLVVRPAHDGERWSFRSDYFEEVWAELLSPTPVLLARRFGRLIEESPNGVEVGVTDLAAGMHVTPAQVERAMGRLARPGLVSWSPSHGVVGTSGFARSVGERGLGQLSARGVETHERFLREAGESERLARRVERVEQLGRSLPSRSSGQSLAVGG